MAGDVNCIDQPIHEGMKPDIREEIPLWIATKDGHRAVVKAPGRRTDMNVNSVLVAERLLPSLPSIYGN